MKPTNITTSATYVVDVRSLQNADDIKKEEFGIWRYSGSLILTILRYMKRRTATWRWRYAVTMPLEW